MKYMLMLYSDESWAENYTDEDLAADWERHNAFSAWCAESGIGIVGGEALVASSAASTVHTDGAVTDGPYLELKEQLGGYYIIEVDSMERAQEAARHCPNDGGIEIRPIMDLA